MVTIPCSDEVFQVFQISLIIVALKMVIMAPLTARQRIKNKSFALIEDAKKRGNGKLIINDDVERVRKSHRNDLENVVPFFLVALVYVFTGPTLFMAKLHFYGFAISRCFFTFFMLKGIQPFRSIAFALAMLSIVSMAVQSLVQLLV